MQYFSSDRYPGQRQYFAFSLDERGLAEAWRLDEDSWVPIDGRRFFGKVIGGDPYLDEISEAELPRHLALPTVVTT